MSVFQKKKTVPIHRKYNLHQWICHSYSLISTNIYIYIYPIGNTEFNYIALLGPPCSAMLGCPWPRTVCRCRRALRTTSAQAPWSYPPSDHNLATHANAQHGTAHSSCRQQAIGNMNHIIANNNVNINTNMDHTYKYWYCEACFEWP